MTDKLFLIDGHALIFKMHYAFLRRPMVNSKGADMSILFGFTKYLLELIEREKPTHLAMAFDLPGGTFRNELYPLYKATRKETPQLVIDALDPLMEICKAMNIPILAVKGYEADDVIGSMAKRSGKEGFLVYMVTPDKDYGQLIDDDIFQYKPGKSGSDNEIIGRKEICEKYGITDPRQVIDMLTICGDTSDNVPGVKGIGEVGASKLIAKYGSVKNIYNHLDELGDKQRKMFEDAEDHIELSHTLVTIKTDIPLDITGDEMRINMDFNPVIADLFRKYEFSSLEKYISHIKSRTKTEQKKTMPLIEETGTEEICKAAAAAGNCAIITEGAGQGIFTSVKKITVAAFPGHGNAESGMGKGRILAAEGSEKDFAGLLEDGKISKFGFDLKQQMDILAGNGITIRGKLFDIGLLHYLLDPEKSHRQDILAKSYLDINLSETEGTEAEVSGDLFADEENGDPVRERRKYEEAATDLLLGEKITAEVNKDERTAGLYGKMEEPLIRVLSKMERNGVKVDLEQLRLYAEGLKKELAGREDKIREMTGEPDLNVSSPKQIGEALFGKLGLDPKAKKNKNGSYSTDEATLSALSYKHPVIDEILEFRAVKKLLSTYIEPFPGYISPITGKIHTTFNQALTSTGRLSSSNPNLQNIPIRSERGKEIRKAFIPGTPDGIILSADYSQIELRIMAHLSNDAHLISAFNAGKDIHAATASKIFGVPHEQVTSEQRRIAKTANFGIMYGISAFGLSQRLGISRNEAKKIIDDYFASFPAISSFIERTLSDARKNGYVETLFGRRRYLPDINSKNATIRALAERNAVNAPIQGTSADIIKLAMIGVNDSMEEAGLKSKMVLQIHDELVFDALPEEIERLRDIVVFQMENVIKLSVPLTVECNYGKNWLEAH